MPFIQGSISSNEDLIKVVEAMSNMLTQGDYSAELWLELALVKHKLDKLNNSELGGDVYKHVGILYALKSHLEDTLHELEEADKEPQEVGYDDIYNLEERLRKLEDIDNGPQETGYDDFYEDEDDDEEGNGEEYEGLTLTSEEFLEEILEKLNAKTQVEIRKLRNGNISC